MFKYGDFFFFFQAEDGIRDVAVTGVQTCALPISRVRHRCAGRLQGGTRRSPSFRAESGAQGGAEGAAPYARDRKSTRLNSSHGYISYAVFCLKKKKKTPRLSTARHLQQKPQPHTA